MGDLEFFPLVVYVTVQYCSYILFETGHLEQKAWTIKKQAGLCSDKL